MSNETLTHINFTGVAEYVSALDKLCEQAQRSIFIFEKDFVNIDFNSEARYEILRRFLLSNPNNHFKLLAQNTRPISQYCPRLMTLLRQFGHNMFIYQTPKQLLHLTEPFAIVDGSSYVRRFHFEDSRGVLGLNDTTGALKYTSRYLEMWEVSTASVSTATFTL